MASATTARSRPTLGGFDPFKPLFRLLTSIRFALIQLGVVALAALLGVVFPQAPDSVRLSPTAYDAWTEAQRGAYGPFTEAMRRLDLFEVFHSVWFNGLLVLLLVSVGVCTANRFAPIWRSVRRPLRRPNDRYFETAHARADFPTPADPDAVAAVLRRKRFKVEVTGGRDGARYFFADRYAWAQFATFASHLSLILFMAGGIVSKIAGFETFVEVGEGATQPVFPVVHDNQMQILNLDSIEGRDAEGNIIDYRTHAVVFQNGEERCRGEITVNGPLRCNGYTFHQAAYTANGVALQVRDRNTGQVVLAEAPVLQEQVPAPRPRLRVRDASGAVVLDESFTMAPVSQERLAQIFAVPGSDRPFAVSGPLDTSTGAWQLDIVRVPRPGDPAGEQTRLALRRGETGQLGGYAFEFVELGGNPYEVITGIPGMERAAFIQLARDAGGAVYVDVVNMAARNPESARLQLAPGESTVVGEYEYTFQGRREHTGVLVKRDPGSWFIWTATALLMGGLLVTFYVPRRRLWVKVTPETTYLAGLADRGAHLSDELRELGDEMRAAGGPVQSAQDDRADVDAPNRATWHASGGVEER